MGVKVDLLVIDPQNDFCTPGGALFVENADHDMDRLAKMVARLSGRLADIHVTLDSHHFVDCAHPIFWKDGNGAHPTTNPPTQITLDDLDASRWMTTKPSLQRRMYDYVKALEDGKRYPLYIWPPHCLIGTPGHAVRQGLWDALRGWEEDRFATVNYVTKGSNIFTEHYSAVKAEVPDPTDPSTQLNTDLIGTLEGADVILLSGEAGSHCLANTTIDTADSFQDDSAISKMVLLEDATSPVPHPDGIFKTMQEEFIHKMTQRGMQLSTTDKFAA